MGKGRKFPPRLRLRVPFVSKSGQSPALSADIAGRGVMAVYVDDARNPFGRYLMCHMWADTLEELLAMVDRIGIKRKYLQQPPKASWVHFDVCQSKRALAIDAGAIVTDKYGPSEHVAKLRGNQKMLDAIAEIRAREKGARANGFVCEEG